MIPKQLIGCRFNRVRFKDKAAFEKDWQNNPYSYEEIKKYFPKENYGVLCGSELRVLDDDTEKKGLIKIFLDNFGETFRVRDHLYFRFDNGNSKKIIFMNGKYHLGELQGEGQYVVGGGSTHPSGEIYEIKNNAEIITISYDKFLEVFSEFIKKEEYSNAKIIFNVEDDDFIKNIKEKWVEGNRQDLAMSLAGYLRKERRLGLQSCLNIVEGICRDCNDNEISSRLASVRATYDKDECDVKGYSGLKEKEVSVETDLEEMKNYIKNLIFAKKEDLCSEEITNYILNNNNIYTTRDDIKSEIWFYDDGIYVPNGKSRIQEITRKILEEAYTPQRVNKIIAKIEADTQIEQEEFFKNNSKEEIPVKNGILNIFSKEINQFTPEKIFFNKIPVIYNPNKECPNIEQFFRDILKSEDDSKVMFELLGFSLLKEYRFEKAFMFVGNGRNGKGKTLSLIKYFLGIENCSSVPLSQLTSGSTSVCELHNRLVNLAGDLSNTELKETGMFKQLTGRDLISAKRKYLRDLFFENYAKMVFACNELPKVYDLSEGFWSRWILFEFPYTFIKEEFYNKLSEEEKKSHKIIDDNIIDKLTTEEELSGLLNKSLDYLSKITQNKGFSYSSGTKEVKDLWIRKSDSFIAFCLDHLEEDIDSSIPKKNLRRAFSRYCRDYKLPGASDTAIKITLENKYGVYDSQDSTTGDRIWEGIRFKNKK